MTPREYPLYDDHAGCPTARYVGGTSKFLCECDPPCEAAQAAELAYCRTQSARLVELARQTSDRVALAATTAFVLELTRRGAAAEDALRKIRRPK